MEWIEDAKGNKCGVEYFGGEAKARAALESLKNCERCINCSGCSGCSGCSDCSDCSRCSRCSRCSDCSGCSRCSDCSRCSRCSDCSGCSGCSDCSRCSDCSGCSGCSRCSGCSDCSRCSRCSDCSRCSRCSDCSRCSRCSDMKNAKPQGGQTVVPPVPVIPDIHQRVFKAAIAPGALNMKTWHTCETTHCRAGWVVHLAGEAGKALEQFHDTPLAASLIYQASSPLPVSMARFFDANEAAMADMERLAELEKQAAGTSEAGHPIPDGTENR